MPDKSDSYWSDADQGLRAVELRAAGFDPTETAKTNAVITIANAYTNAQTWPLPALAKCSTGQCTQYAA